MFEISKGFKWEAAHRLSDGYVGKCSSLHGHSYTCEVVLTGSKLDKAGMLMDFGDLGFVKKFINARWDHSLILWEDDPLRKVIQDAQVFDVIGLQKMYFMAAQPTAENLARELCHLVMNDLEFRINFIQSVKVRVWETISCSATYHGELSE